MQSNEITMSLADLAQQSGVPGRTIRYYIARGLLAGPVKAGRAAAYGPEHLAKLGEIQKLQAQGLTLAEMAGALAGERAAAPEPVLWQHYAVSADVVVLVRADASPWRLKQIRGGVAALAERLRQAP